MTGKGKNSIGRTPEQLDQYRKVVPVGEKECVWAEAGVVHYKLCDGNFDCINCSFDIAMRGGNELLPKNLQSVGGELCPHCFYSLGHTWAQVEENAHVRIGIDDFGQQVLGPVEEICLPLRDEHIGKKSIRVKARNTIVPLIPPVDGYIEKINESLIKQPQLLNMSPYEGGWLVLLRPTRLVKNLKELFYGAAAIQWFEMEMNRLSTMISAEMYQEKDEQLGLTMPDGGMPDFNILNQLPATIIKKVMEQCFLSCHPNDKPKA